MPSTVDKSPLVEYDSEKEEALQKVIDTLEIQSDFVKSVSVLANFSIDKLATLKHGTTIVQGLVVKVAKEYKLSDNDMVWFHPEIASGRSIYEVDSVVVPSKLAGVELDGIQSSVGAYSILRPDEFGCETVQHCIVIDTSVTSSLSGLYKKWLATGITAGEVDKQWKRMKFGEKYGITTVVTDMRESMAKNISSSAKMVYSDTVRAVFSDTTSIYFTNNAVKKNTTELLVKSSALGGYRMYNTTNESILFYPGTLGSAKEYYAWDKLSSKNCQRIEKSCAWDGELTFNAVVMQPPSISGKNIRKMEDAYELSFRDTLNMNIARFSSSDSVRDRFSPVDMYNLEPDSKHVSNARAFISAPVDMNHPILHKLMGQIQNIQKEHPSFQIFNPKIMKDGRLKIPKEIYKQLA